MFDSRPWCMSYAGNKPKAVLRRNSVLFHRVILGLNKEKVVVDHKNHNVTDNRKSNLRVTSRGWNVINSQKRTDNTSGIKGVRYDAPNNSWRAEVRMNGKNHSKRFKNCDEAVEWVEKVRNELHGEFACHG